MTDGVHGDSLRCEYCDRACAASARVRRSDASSVGGAEPARQMHSVKYECVKLTVCKIEACPCTPLFRSRTPHLL
ncbi:hypothetical protein FM105_01805 [Brevibacterium yomogidense]|uniref:Uncharacterized protein n=1 Tax=Brevibacterium yomogidense TaxID=946573 RepID=A0A1X6WYP3_9MICO|nr:hypothetical protein FM105_01805 [Brevibacterium yomogidense]